MIIVDEVLRRREAESRPIRVGMVGAGFMGRGIANQIRNSVPGIELVAVANRTVDNGLRALREAGDAPELVDSVDALSACAERGVGAVTDDPGLLTESPDVDCVVEVTGTIEHAAAVTLAAIDARKPTVLMNAELDGTVGPLLHAKAREAGVVLTGSDGDQPGVQANLHRFVKGIGAEPLVCGNVKGLQDPYRNPTTQEAFARRWGQDPHMVTSFADGTKISFEQAVVANATGMRVQRRGMNGFEHDGHIDELTERYDVDELRAAGGFVDYVVGANPSPGIFVLGAHDDPRQRHYLELYKLGPGPLYSFYTPYHLCHFELPSSVVRAVDFDDATLAPLGGPRVEVVATAKVDLEPGMELDALGGYLHYGEAENADVVAEERLLPIGVAVGCRVVRRVARDATLTYDDVEVPEGRLVDRLRAEQAERFAAAA